MIWSTEMKTIKGLENGAGMTIWFRSLFSLIYLLES